MKKYSLLFPFLLTICFSCSNVEKRFVGLWQFVEMIPKNKFNDQSSNDHSMNGFIISIERLPNSDKSYILNFSGMVTILTEENENKLVSINSNVFVTYDPRSRHLSYFYSKDAAIVLKRIE